MGICLILSVDEHQNRTVGRPQKCRFINNSPQYTHFKPRGIPMSNLEEIKITLDEIEAVRLADYRCLYHKKASEKMGVSRQTFGRILASAHKKISDGIINGKALRIRGGNYNFKKNTVLIKSESVKKINTE